jgi:hypothetical protein
LAKLAALTLPAKAASLGVAVALGAAGGVAAHATDTPTDTDTQTEVAVTVDGGADAAAEELETDSTDGTEGTDDTESTEESTDDEGALSHTHQLPEAAEFGQSVAVDARDGGVVGAEVAEAARVRAQVRVEEHVQGELPAIDLPDVVPDGVTVPALGAGQGARP